MCCAVDEGAVGTAQVGDHVRVVDAANFGMQTGNLGVVQLQGIRRIPPETSSRLGQFEAGALVGSADHEQCRHSPRFPCDGRSRGIVRFYESKGRNGRAWGRIPPAGEVSANRASCPKAPDAADKAHRRPPLRPPVRPARVVGPPATSPACRPDRARSTRGDGGGPAPSRFRFARLLASAFPDVPRRFAAPRAWMANDRRSAHYMRRPR